VGEENQGEAGAEGNGVGAVFATLMHRRLTAERIEETAVKFIRRSEAALGRTEESRKGIIS